MILKITLIIFTLLASFLGGISNQFTDWTWYELLNKSDLNPPNYIFGLVWPILYLLMAIVSFLNSSKIYRLYIIQLILNSAWSWIFFVLQLTAVAFLDILILIALNVGILVKLFVTKSFISFVSSIALVKFCCFSKFINLNSELSRGKNFQPDWS